MGHQPGLSIRIVVWILPSIFVNSIKISANTETAMLSIGGDGDDKSDGDGDADQITNMIIQR